MDVLPALACALGLACGLTPWLAGRGARLGLVDVPGARSTHAVPTPRVGGLALGAAIAGGLGLAGLAGHMAWDAGWAAVLLPALLFLVLGALDDRRRLSPRTKFLAQGLIAAVAVLLGLRWQGEGVGPFGAVGFGVATPVMTWLWIVAVVTLINFLDGIDLITVATACVPLAAMAGAGVGPGEGLLGAVALGAVLGFAPWNIAPARAFLGDAGTHLLGFLVAPAALHVPGETEALAWPLASAPLLPGVVDVALGLLAKARRGVALWRAHRQHLHQRLTRAGWSHAAVGLRYGVLSLAALAAVGWVAPRAGLLPCLAGALGVWAWHLGLGLWRTRHMPWTF